MTGNSRATSGADHPELRELESLVLALHTSTPVSFIPARSSTFSSTPMYVDDGEYESEWQMVDSTLNNALGYGLTIEELALRISEGGIDMPGLCRWLRAVMVWPGVEYVLLEGKLARLKSALLLWYEYYCLVHPLFVLLTQFHTSANLLQPETS